MPYSDPNVGGEYEIRLLSMFRGGVWGFCPNKNITHSHLERFWENIFCLKKVCVVFFLELKR